MSEIEIKNQRNTEIGEMPASWQIEAIGNLFDVKQGKQLSSKETTENKKLYPFLRTSNIMWGYLNLSNIDGMYFSDEEIEKLKLRDGDILVCEGGDIGRTAMFEGQIQNCAYQNHLHRLRP
ncbi:MAG: restriction endonuclease subunit S, partial [bacterium]